MIYSSHYLGYLKGIMKLEYDRNTIRLCVEGMNVVQYVLDLANLMNADLFGAVMVRKSSESICWTRQVMYARPSSITQVRSILSSSASLSSSHFDPNTRQF